MRLCAVSVDLDEIPNYFAIHGLPEPAGAARTLVYDVAIDRLLGLARELSIPLTLFAIGADLSRPESAAKLREARDAGFELANHSLDHRYDLVRLGGRSLGLGLRLLRLRIVGGSVGLALGITRLGLGGGLLGCPPFLNVNHRTSWA